VPLSRNVELFRRLLTPHGARLSEAGRDAALRSPLVEVTDFGANPGNLQMFGFVPAQWQEPRALVVVLHGCGQTAAGYDLGAGWSTVAKHFGFALLMPQQQVSNNANGCFNWFNRNDASRDSGEAASIRQMIAQMANEHCIDAHRIFVTGLSAGGAMTAVMLATYPDVFAAGAVIAGLPYGIASSVRQALAGMVHSPTRSPRELGDLVRTASNHSGAWPRISVWHGSADRTVNPGNANEIVKQWLDVHGLPLAPMSEKTVDGYPHQVWWNAEGETVVESYTITGMAHGTPIGTAENDERYGAQGPFLIEAGISSSYRIAEFFCLTKWIRQKKESASAELIPTASPMRGAPDRAKRARPRGAEKEPEREPRGRIDVGAVITRALTAAGLIKQ